VAAACSVDVSKLRPPAPTRDAPAERLGGADLLSVGDTVGDSRVGVADTAADPLDLRSTDQPAGDDSNDGSAADETAAAEARPESADVPYPGEDGVDSASGGVDHAGSGDSGDDEGHAGDVTGPDGGVGGDDGAGGTPGTGGVPGTGGTTGTGGVPGTGGTTGTGGATGGSDGTSDTGGTFGTGGRGGTGGSGTGGTTVDPDLVLWYRFDESSGTIATDSSASRSNGTISGGSGSASFSADCQVGSHALRLTPSAYGAGGGYVTTPAPVGLVQDAITIATWVKPASASSSQNWARIFDFGSGTGTNVPYFYLTSRAGDATGAPPRFGISMIGHVTTGEQRIEGSSPLTANVWTHIAVVLPAGATYTGTLYIDGAVAATNNAMTIHPSDIGVTTQNWLGRSPFTSDPYFSGSLDDFRIYRRALSAAEIAALVALR
jgi:hypothetical protein